MRFFAAVAAAAIGIAGPAKADEAACMAAPTRDCLFDLVLERAEADENPKTIVYTLLHLAAWQEVLGMEGSEESVARMLELWRAHEPVPEKRLSDLHLMAMFHLAGRAPVLAKELADAAAAEDVSFPYTDGKVTISGSKWLTVAFLAGHSGDRERARQALMAVEESERAEAAKAAAAGLLRYGDVAGARALADLMPGEDFSTKVEEMILESVLNDKRYDMAITLAEAMGDEDRVAKALVEVARKLAEAGRVEEAVELVQRPVVLSVMKHNSEVAREIALVHAYADDTERMEILLIVNMRTVARTFNESEGIISVYKREEIEARLVAAMVNADAERAVALMNEAEELLFGSVLQIMAIRAYFDAHPDGLAVLLLHVPTERLPDVLAVVAGHQANRGNLDAALETLDRLRTIDPEAAESLRVALPLAPALARAGHARDAVAVAEKWGDLTLLLQVAVLIEEPGFAEEDFPVENLLVKAFLLQ